MCSLRELQTEMGKHYLFFYTSLAKLYQNVSCLNINDKYFIEFDSSLKHFVK